MPNNLTLLILTTSQRLSQRGVHPSFWRAEWLDNDEMVDGLTSKNVTKDTLSLAKTHIKRRGGNGK